MNIECVIEKLEKAVQQTYRITGKNLTLPILSTLHLKAEKNTLTIKATNLDLGVEVSIPVKVIKEGEVAIPADIFSSFINSISKEQNVSLEAVDGVVCIKTQSNNTKISTYPVDDFPKIPHIKDGKEFLINKNDFIAGLQSVVFSASNSSIKPELSSVYIYTNKDNKLVFVATDSFRLAEKSVILTKEFNSDPILLPAKNIPEILRIINDSDNDISVLIDGSQISLTFDGLYVVSRTIDGTFPDYKQIIPKDFVTQVTVLKEDLLSALKTVNIFSNKLNQVKFSVNINNNTFNISTKNSDIGETDTALDAKMEGEDVDVTFNHKYILDCFSSVNSDSVILKLNTGNKPMIIQPVSDQSFFYLIMPMNV